MHLLSPLTSRSAESLRLTFSKDDMKRRMLDLFAGRLGWSKAFLARGWDVVAYDLVLPDMEIPAGVDYRLADILTLTPADVQGFDFICASSPCEKFSIHRMKMFHPNPPYPDLGIRLFNHARYLCESSGAQYIMENVQTAQQFVGDAAAHAGSFYLWGTGVPAIIPKGLTKGMKMDRQWCQELGGHGSSKRDTQTAGFATIPPELASCVADYAARLIEQCRPTASAPQPYPTAAGTQAAPSRA